MRLGNSNPKIWPFLCYHVSYSYCERTRWCCTVFVTSTKATLTKEIVKIKTYKSPLQQNVQCLPCEEHTQSSAFKNTCVEPFEVLRAYFFLARLEYYSLPLCVAFLFPMLSYVHAKQWPPDTFIVICIRLQLNDVIATSSYHVSTCMASKTR